MDSKGSKDGDDKKHPDLETLDLTAKEECTKEVDGQDKAPDKDGADVVVCRTEVAPNTGKHGNPHYAAQLAETTGKDESEDTKSEPPKKKPKSKLDTSPTKSKVDTSLTKSKVDTSPKKSKVDTSLTKSKLDTSPPKSFSTKGRPEKFVDQRGSARDRTTTGGSGKPNQEEKAGVTTATGPVVVKTKTQASTGSRGNPHYMAELNRVTKTASRGQHGTTTTPKPNASDTTTTNPSKVTHKTPTPRPVSTRHTRPVSAVSDTHQSNRTKTTATNLALSRPYSARQRITTDKAAPGKKSGVHRGMDDVDQTIASKDGGQTQKQSNVSKTTTANAKASANSAARGRRSPTLSTKNNDPSVISAKMEKKPFTTSSRPTSTSSVPNGISSRPGSTSSRPTSTSSRPTSTSSRPGSTSTQPSSSSSRAGNISSRTLVKSTKPVNGTVNEAGSSSDALTSKTSSRSVSSSKTMSVSSRPTSTSTRPGSSGSSRPGSTTNTKKTITPAQKDGVKDTIKTIVRSNAATNVKDRSLKPSARPSGLVNGAASDSTRKVVPSKVGTLKSTPAVIHSKNNKPETGEKSGLLSKANLAKASSSGGGQGTKSRSKPSDGTAEQGQGRNTTVRDNSAGSRNDVKGSKGSAIKRVSGGSVVKQQKPSGKAKRNDDKEAVDVQTVNSGAEIEPEKEASDMVQGQPTADTSKVGVIQADIIAVEHAQNTDDRGNPHYAKELEDMAGQKERERQEHTDDLKDAIESIIGSQIGEKDSGASIESEKREQGQVNIKPGQVEMDQKDVIQASQVNVLGDRGNPHYAKELEKPEEMEKKEEISAVKVVPVSSAKKQEAIKETKAGVTGDKGNPYYKEELNKADNSSNTKEKPEEPVLVQKVEDAAKVGSSAPDQKSKGAGDKDKHMKEKDVAGNVEGGIAAGIEPVVKVTNTAITGDKGNIHYAKELEALAGLKTEGTGGEREVLQAETVTCVTTARPAVGHDNVKKGGQSESAVKKTEAAVTGDKGNPHYAEELNRISESMAQVDEKERGNKEARIGDVKSEEAASGIVKQDIKMTQVSKVGCQPGVGQAKVEPVIRAVDAAVSGDRGNIHYTRELEALSAEVKSGGNPELEKQEIIKVEKLPTCTKGVAAGASKLQSEPVIKSESAGICGDKGNVHYARELEAVSGEMQGSSSKPDVIKQEEIKVQHLQTTKAQAPKKDDSQKADVKETSKPQKEPMIKAESASVTGDKGNVHYAKELEVLSREVSGNVKQSAEKQEEIVVESVTMMKTSAPVTGTGMKKGCTEPGKSAQPVINAESAAICGDKGNTHYAKELEALSDEVSAGQKNKPQTEQAIKAVSVAEVKSVAPEAGTKGTGKELATKSQGEARITAEKAAMTGDRGNVHYAKELEALTGKLEGESKSDKEKQEELMVESVCYSKTSAPPTAAGVPQSETVKAKTEPEIEDVSAAVTGDRGNAHYGRELAALAGQVSKEEKEVLKAEQVAGVKSGVTTGSERAKPQVEPVIEATHNTAVCGDKGNVHYAKELEALSKEVSADKKQEAEIKIESVTMATTSAALKGECKVDATEEVMKSGGAGKSMITSECAAVSGDKGNMHYAKELDALAGVMHKDSQPIKQETGGIKAESVSQTSQVVAKEKDEQNKSGNVTPQGEAVIKTIHTAVTGDKGNVHYAEELDALSRQTMGDQKDHSVPKPEEAKVEAVSVVKTSASTAKNVEDKKAETVVAQKEPTINASEAAVTGDRGNVHYARELAALAKEPVDDKTDNSKKREEIKAEAVQVVTTSASMTGTSPGEPIIKATHGAVTGDKGNVHYVKELDAVGSKEKMDDKKLEVKVENVPVVKSSRPSTGAKEQAAKVETETVGTQSEIVLNAIHAAVSGDKANVHYSKDLEALSKEMDDGKKMQSKDEQADKIEVQMVSATSAPVMGQGKAMEPQIVGTKASVTGDRGNVHYAAELERASETTASKDSKSQKQEERSEEPLKVVHAQVTGDKGNPHYAAELEESHAKQTKGDQAKESSGKGEGQVNTKGQKDMGEGQSDENMNIAGKDSQNQGPVVSLEDVKPKLTAKKSSKKSRKK